MCETRFSQIHVSFGSENFFPSNLLGIERMLVVFYIICEFCQCVEVFHRLFVKHDAEGVFDISEKRNLAQRVHRQVDFEVVVFISDALCLILDESLQHLVDLALAFE